MDEFISYLLVIRNMKFNCFIFLWFAFLAMITVEAVEPQHDNMGGWKQISTEAKAFFYARHINGVWWLVNPAGNAFISKGVNHISFTGEFAPPLGYSPYWRLTMKKYQQVSLWANAAVDNLKRWNFNTIGAGSTPSLFKKGIPYTVMLNFCAETGGDKRRGLLPDVFDKDFERKAALAAKNLCTKHQNDIYLLGYFIDNELYWAADENSPTSMLINYLFLPKNTAGVKYAAAFLKERYTDTASFNQAWNLNLESMEDITKIKTFPLSEARSQDEEAFLELYAKQYFQTCHNAIKKADPNHLIFSCRFSSKAPEPVLRAIKGHVDVVCYNNYSHVPPAEELFRIFEITRLPVLISELSFKAVDSKLLNQIGAGKAVANQAVAYQSDRAALFSSYINDVMSLPFMVGYHWYEYTDQPAEGRFDGANNNYGLVNIKDEPWEELTQEMMKTNEKIESIHAGMR